MENTPLLLVVALILAVVFLLLVLVLRKRIKDIQEIHSLEEMDAQQKSVQDYAQRLNSEQIEQLLTARQAMRGGEDHSGVASAVKMIVLFAGLSLSANPALAQDAAREGHGTLLSQPGVILTIILLLIPLLVGGFILAVKASNIVRLYRNRQRLTIAEKLAQHLLSLPEGEVESVLQKRKHALDYHLTNRELSGHLEPDDQKGLLHIHREAGLPIVPVKQKAQERPGIDPALSKLVLWYLSCAALWLLLGTTIGEYVGIKFVAPDADHISWLSFGRLRPVHTNMVFWGWASLGMLGLGYYVIPRVSNTALYSIKKGWYALWSINVSVLIGTLCLMAGINNGGGEYREYVWPVTLLFAIGLLLTLYNFIQTIARRVTREIYISGWYMVAALMFAIVITVVAYVPYWQNGLGETIIQGYYMHQGVGMWFMLFTLGIVYYFLPQQLNRPIYSYSLGILAFWTQILFYTLIGTHHFVFSAIPWWLQTVAIVGSMGMVIPVLAGTTNFILTFKGAWYKLRDSYTLPFFIVGIVFYFTGSMQGTAEAFRYTNLIWHFTDFTVAHSHLTMYGIISFFLWACIYAVVPRLTGREAPQITIGAHFWLALIGLLFYTIPLMYGSTLKGLMWMEGKPFIESVQLMVPYWVWRAVGGSLMWLSHLFFAWNLYQMIAPRHVVDVKEAAIQQIIHQPVTV